MIVILNEQLAIAGTLTHADIAEIARRGYQTLIDLRADGEPAAGGLSPTQVCQYATALRLAYYQIPVTVSALTDTTIEAVRRTLREAQGPILLHCVSGRRACALALLHCSCEEGASVAQYSVKAQALGLDWDSLPGLREFCLEYLIRHSPAHRICAERADTSLQSV
jgi:uncharacterized protein (TIGR01244 family)